jgi:hypothetical protein
MTPLIFALLGDGILHRWGDECTELQSELSRLYTHTSFEIQNHGLQDSRVGNGLWRVGTDYEKSGVKTRHLSYFNPALVLVESFAYTQFWDGPEGLGEYRDLLRRIWEEIERTTTAKTLFCLAPPPLRDKFMEGSRNFQNTSKAQRARFADGVKMYLDEARQIAEDEGWPMADIADEVEKRVKAGESARRFIDGHDNIYPSHLGYQVCASVIVRTIDNQRFVDDRVTR